MKKYTTDEINNYKNEIIDILNKHPNRYGNILHSSENVYLINFLSDLFPQLNNDYYNLNTKIYWLLHNITDFPQCENEKCHNKNLKKAFSPYKYPKYCCRFCAATAEKTKIKTQETSLKRYGVKCTFQTKKSIDNIHKSVIEKYGGTTGNIWETDYGKKKCFETRLKKNNGNFESIETKIKRQNTIKNKFNSVSGNIFDTEYCKEKIKNTCLKKYGTYHPNKTNIARKRQSDYMNRADIKKHLNEIKLHNGTFNTSKPEEETYKLLSEKFGKDDIFRQYRSEKYPFACDFYIKSIDTYIECNYSWTHGGHLFDENNSKDIEKLNKWKEKGTKYYLNAINTWTIRDVLKNKIAKENNLKYLAFWKLNDLITFLKK